MGTGNRDSKMRSALCRCMRIRTVPASAIQPGQLRLPPTLTWGSNSSSSTSSDVTQTKASKKRTSPTIDTLLERTADVPSLPPNLRIEKHVSAKELYADVAESDREVLKRFQRE